MNQATEDSIQILSHPVKKGIEIVKKGIEIPIASRHWLHLAYYRNEPVELCEELC
jgi:hypothetical protein